MDIQEADIAAMGRAELEELIDRAVRPDVPLRVLFAALDRYTELLRPVLDDEVEDGTGTGTGTDGAAGAEVPAGVGRAAGVQGASGAAGRAGLPGP
ncbi:hypothetical protein GCM10009839_63130 [Catenulispora yoronensis]|uniref:FXSXX-COOH protein n=1 Tax=Catenulispora yoronensis TaxID=450799 RepID=A0ABN2V2R4_9ACTN